MAMCDQQSIQIAFTAINEILSNSPGHVIELVKQYGDEFYLITDLPLVSLKELMEW